MTPRLIAGGLCLVALTGLAGCGGSTDGTTAPPTALEARGELLSYACQACHSLEAGGPNQVGPNLHGVFGRRAGTVEGFEYSPALRRLDLVWTAEALERWLADPTGFVPGTTMAFTGYQDPADRRALIEYLERATAAGSAGAAD